MALLQTMATAMEIAGAERVADDRDEACGNSVGYAVLLEPRGDGDASEPWEQNQRRQ